MALEMSTQGTINSLLSSVPLNSETNTANTAEEAASDSQMLPPLFASLLASQSEITNSTSSDQDSEQMLNTGLLEGFASDEAISVMQNQLLGALQNNVFAAFVSSASSTTDTADTSEATSITEQDASIIEPSTMNSMLTSLFGDDGISVQDGFDALNIVNHLPVVSDIYEQTTSTHIAAASSLAGSFIYGGLGGLAYNAVDLTIEGITGKSISSNLWDYGKQLISDYTTPGTTTELPTTDIQGIPSDVATSAYEFARKSLTDE